MARATGKRTPAQRLIEEMSRGRIAVDAAIDSLLEAAQDGLPDATLDHDRRRRLGHPESSSARARRPRRWRRSPSA
jgi:NCAIR mutase (PurE)-related protein